MFHPPETFPQLRALIWAAPMVCGLCVLGAAWAIGLRALAWPVGLAASATSCALALVAVWASAYGVRHSLVTAGVMFLLVCLPLSIALVPAVAPVIQYGWMPVVLVASLQLLLTLVATAYHARTAVLPAAAQVVTWSDCQINVVRGTIAKVAKVSVEQEGQTRWVSPALVGAASVGLYSGLKAWLPVESLVLLALVIANTLAGWLSAGPIARAWGQSYQLRRVEHQSGRRFVSSRLAWLEQERARSPFGRWVRRCMSPHS